MSQLRFRKALSILMLLGTLGALSVIIGLQTSPVNAAQPTVTAPAAATPITLGQTVNGTLGTSDEVDVYSFTVEAGQRIIIQGINTTVVQPALILNDPNGFQIFEFSFSNTFYEVRELFEAGTYTIEFYAWFGSKGSYSFKLWDGTDDFNYTLGTPVSADNPQPGMGKLETRAMQDVYHISAVAGDRIIIKGGNTAISQLSYKLLNPNGELVDEFGLKDAEEPYILTLTGTYKFVVYQPFAASFGNYEFVILDGYDNHNITFGDIIEPDIASGKGILEVKTMIDVYEFTAEKGNSIFLDAKSSDVTIAWVLYDPTGKQLFNNNFIDQQFNAATSGTYRLQIQTRFLESTAQFSFVLVKGGADLINNGGFEPNLTGWQGKNLVMDKVRCNKDKDGDGVDDKVYAFEGECAMVFVGAAGENSMIKQSLSVDAIGVGNNITLRAMVQGRRAGPGFMKLTLVYKNPFAGKKGNGRDILKVKFNQNTYGYTPFAGDVVVDDEVATANVMVKYRGTSGKLYLDRVVARVEGGAPAIADAGDLLALPEAVDGSKAAPDAPQTLPEGFKN